MGLESATYVDGLVQANPLGADDRSQGDNHLRLIKEVLKNTFPNASKAFRFPTTAAVATSTVNVAFPSDQNKLFPVNANAAPVIVNLPDPTSGGTVHEDGFSVIVTKVDSSANAVTITPSGAQTINGASDLDLTSQWSQAILIWAQSDAEWYAITPAIAQGLILSAAASLLTLRRTENDAVAREIISIQSGSGAGDKATVQLVGDGVNGVAALRVLIDTTRLLSWLETALNFHKPVGVGAADDTPTVLMHPDGYIEAFDIGSAPSAPAADYGRLYQRTINSVLRWAYKDENDDERVFATGEGAQLVGIIEDQKSQNTAGGDFDSGADRTRVLNTLVYNRDSTISLASNQFTLPAGDWEIEWEAPALGNLHQSMLYNVTDAAVVQRGNIGADGVGFGSPTTVTLSRGSTRVTITASKAFEIRHRIGTTQASNGFGVAGNFGTEVYTRVVVRSAA